MTRPRALAGALTLPLLAAPGAASAAGFALFEHGVSGLGNAYAGGAAVAADATTVFFNPAGMTRLRGRQLVLAANIIGPTIEFTNEASSVSGPGRSASIAPARGYSADGGEAGEDLLVPSFYYTHALGDRWTVGVSLDTPFGLATEYEAGWVGRYEAIKSELRTFNLNPSAAFKVNDALSLGAGVSVMYTDVELTRAIDACAAGGQPGACDTHSKVSGDAVSLGLNVGLLYELSADTRFGLAYRTWQEPDIDGEGNFKFHPLSAQIAVAPGVSLADALIGAGFVDGTDASADLPLPDTVSLSFYHALTPQWAIMGDVTWTEWSAVDSVDIDFDSGLTTTLDLAYQDAFRYALGLNYSPSGPWTLRLGVAYDEEPVRNLRTRTARLPGNDRLWVAVGAQYAPGNNLTLDVGYAHLFVDDTRIDHAQSEGGVTHALVGDYDLAVDILGVQASWSF
jgi:long-chain fatty acid transport protein